LSLYASWFTKKIAAYPGVSTCNLSAHGLAIPGMNHIPLESLLAGPSIRTEVSSRIEASCCAMNASGSAGSAPGDIDAIIHDLTTELSRLAELADRAVEVAGSAKGTSGDKLQGMLAMLAGIDDEVLASTARDVVGFLFASASEAVGGRARNIDESLDRTMRLYSSVAESARWHAASLV